MAPPPPRPDTAVGELPLLPSLLCDAAANNDVATIRQIVRAGGLSQRVDIPDYDGRTPLHLAVANGHFDTAQQLLAVGHDPNLLDRFGISPLWQAVLRGRKRIGLHLISCGAKLCKRPVEIGLHLCQLAKIGDCEALTVAVALGCDPSARDYDHRTALHVAADCGAVNVLKCLLRLQADMSLQDRWGRTPWESAQQQQQQQQSLQREQKVSGGAGGKFDEIRSLLTRQRWTTAVASLKREAR